MKWFFRLFLRSSQTWTNYFNSIERLSWQSWSLRCCYKVALLSGWLSNVPFGFSSWPPFELKAFLCNGRISISPFFDRPENLPIKTNASCCMAHVQLIVDSIPNQPNETNDSNEVKFHSNPILLFPLKSEFYFSSLWKKLVKIRGDERWKWAWYRKDPVTNSLSCNVQMNK